VSARSGDPHTSGTILVGITGAILVFVLIVALQALFYHVQENAVRQKTYPEAPAELSRVQAEQLEHLNSYRWVDKEKGIVGIPIEEAMKQVAADNGAEFDAAGDTTNQGGSP
jgi:hypothetical protein